MLSIMAHQELFQQSTEEGEEEEDEDREDLVVKHGLLSTRRLKVEEKVLSLVYHTAEESCTVLFDGSVGVYQNGVCRRRVMETLGCQKLLYAHQHDMFVGVAKTSLKVQFQFHYVII